MNCPGSINLSALAPPDKGSVYASAGTAAHEIMERCLTNNVAPELFLDTIIQTDDMAHPITVDEEMCEAVQVVLDYVDLQIREAGARLVGVEVRFDLSPLNPPGPMYGRADVVLQHPGIAPRRFHKDGQLVVVMPKPGPLEVVDFKYGQGTVVEVERNSQLMYYALGAVVASNEIPAKLKSTVIQPRAPHTDGIVRSWEYEYSELKAFKEDLFTAAQATQHDDAPLNPGGWCKFCPALSVCPAQLERAQEAAGVDFSVVPVEEVTQMPAPEALGLEQLQRIMTAAPVVDAFLKAVASHLRDRTEAGEDTGYKLVPKRGRRLWRDEELVEREAERAGLGESAYAPRKLKSVTQMEKALKAEGGALPEDMWSMVSSGTNLVPNSDPRQALPPANAPPEADFEVQVIVEEVPSTYDEQGQCEKGLPPGVHAEGVLEVIDEASAVIVEDGRNLEVENDLTPGAVVVEAELMTPAEVEYHEVEPSMWMVEVGDNMFFVEADSEAGARNEARAYLGVDRLPNHTRLTPS